MRKTVAVVGAGLAGLSAGVALASRGARVTLVEGRSIGHAGGSSQGQERITRTAYDHPFWVRTMVEATAAWIELARWAGRDLVRPCGGLFWGPEQGGIGACASAVTEAGAAVDRLPLRRAVRDFPGFRFSRGDVVLRDPGAGVLGAAEVLGALLARVERLGGELRVGRPVEEATGGGVLLSDGTRLETDAVVVCGGPWTARLLPSLAARLHVVHQHVGFYASAQPDLPVWAYFGGPDEAVPFLYGLPAWSGGTLKAAEHVRDVPGQDPDGPTDALRLEPLEAFLAERVPAAGARVASARCPYTCAAGDFPLVGAVPGQPGLFVVAGLSGHGFKLGPVLGRWVAEAVLEGRPVPELVRL